MTIAIADGRGALWQWDTGRRVKITDGDGVKQIHYQNKCFGRSVDVDVEDDGTAIIPDELLQDCHTLTAYAYVTDDTGAYTMVQQDFAVHKRAKPADYVFTPVEQTTIAELSERIDKIEESQNPDAIKNAVEDYLKKNPVEAPVQSVNGQIGKVELTAKDVGAISQDDLANVQSTIAAKMDSYTIKTVMDSVATPHTQYYLGNQTSVDIVLPDSANVGQIIMVCWYNGDTAATLSITGTMLSFDYTPYANTRSEINALWDGTYWAVLGNEMAVPSEVTA